MAESRLFRIVYVLLERDNVTAKELAEQFEVSVRTIYRDVDRLSSAGIPIYTMQGRDGGIRLAEDFVLNSSLLNQSEKEQLLVALQGLEVTGLLHENELLTKLSTLFQLNQPNWIEVDFTSWSNSKKYEELFQNLKNAIISKQVISFSYVSNKEEFTQRQVKPVRLLFKGQSWYLYAFCLVRNDFRYFKLSRISQLKLLPQHFADNFDNVSLEKEARSEEVIRVKLKFNKKVAFRVYDELDCPVKEDEQGNLYAEIEIPNDYSLYCYILSFGDNVEVLEPTKIRMQVTEMIECMAQKYKN